MNGYKILGIVLATVAFYFVGFFWYGFIFSELWMAESHVTEAQAASGSPLWMIVGIVLTAMQVVGLSYILNWRGRPDMGEAIKSIGIISLLIPVAFCMYALAYMPQHSMPLFLVDACHLILGWLVATAILTKFRT